MDALNPKDHFLDSEQPDWHLNACVGPQVADDHKWYYYTEGFKRAADSLVTRLVEGEQTALPIDLGVYPILFLYRHHFELLLKSIIVSAKRWEQVPDNVPHGHDLEKLWAQAEPMARAVWPRADWQECAHVSRLLAELEEVDRKGQLLRYPVATNGETSFEGRPLVNVRHFAHTADKLHRFLSGIHDGIEHMLEQRRDYEMEMRGNMQ